MPAPQERRYPIFVTLERGLNVSFLANIQPTVIESQNRISSFLGSVSFACVNLLFNAKDFTCYEIKYIIQKSTVGILISSQNQIEKTGRKIQ